MNRAIAAAVTTAQQASDCDRAAIASGIASFSLMLNAGTAAAALILRDCRDRLASGVAVFVGSGNNGGDGYVVAAQLRRAGIRVGVHVARPPATEDAKRAAVIAGPLPEPSGGEQVVVDALLGTGHRGELRGEIATAAALLGDYRERGATVVAVDLPSGLDADNGDIATGTVAAEVTVAFGTIKRGTLTARDTAGRIVLADIGIGDFVSERAEIWRLATPELLSGVLTREQWNSWKTRRGVVGIVGGKAGMAGASVLACTGALAAGAGLVYAWVDAVSVPVLQSAVPQVVVMPEADAAEAVMPGSGANAISRCVAAAVGPGLGTTHVARSLVLFWLEGECDLVLDADALNVIVACAEEAGESAAEYLRRYARTGRSIVCTPHAGEFERLTGCSASAPLAERVSCAQEFADVSGSVVLLKGTPSVVVAPGSVVAPVVVARGTPALATGGSGDLLTGLTATLLARGKSAPEVSGATTQIAGDSLYALYAAVTAAWLHGRAAEIASADAGTTRGVPLSAVAAAVVQAWSELEVHGALSSHGDMLRGDMRCGSIITELPDVNRVSSGV